MKLNIPGVRGLAPRARGGRRLGELGGMRVGAVQFHVNSKMK